MKGRYHHWSTSYVQPGPDGKYVYTGGHGVLTTRLTDVPDAAYSGNGSSGQVDDFYLPSHYGPFYAHVHMKTGFRKPTETTISHGLSVYMMGYKRPITQVPDAGVPTYSTWDAIRGLGIERMIHIIPRDRLLVVIPSGRDKLMLHSLNLEEALDKSGIPYLLVTSDPPASARRGKAVTYQITAKSKAGDIQFKLETGPPGMTMTPQGALSWNVPADYPLGVTNVIVGVRAGGRETFHTFALWVEEAG